MSTSPTQVLILGGGPAGLTLAHALAARPGIGITLVEREPSPFESATTTERSYTIDITGHGLKAVRYLDMESAFDEALIRFRGIQLHRPFARKLPWDDQGWTGSRGDILKAILGDLEKKHPGRVDFRWETKVDSVDVMAGTAMFDGESHSFDLIVACDGAGSRTRDTMEELPDFTIERGSLPNYCTMVHFDQNTEDLDPEYLQVLNSHPFTVAGAVNGKDKSDPRWFCMVGFNHEHKFGADGNAIADARSYFDKHTDAGKYISDEEMKNFVARKCYHIGRFAKCSRLYAGKTALLGDAAAAFPPIGQGINAAMESAMVFDQAIGAIGAGDSPEALLQAVELYNEKWKPEADAVLWIATRWTFSNIGMTAKMLLADFLGCNVITLSKHESYSQVYDDARKRLDRLGFMKHFVE